MSNKLHLPQAVSSKQPVPSEAGHLTCWRQCWGRSQWALQYYPWRGGGHGFRSPVQCHPRMRNECPLSREGASTLHGNGMFVKQYEIIPKFTIFGGNATPKYGGFKAKKKLAVISSGSQSWQWKKHLFIDDVPSYTPAFVRNCPLPGLIISGLRHII